MKCIRQATLKLPAPETSLSDPCGTPHAASVLGKAAHLAVGTVPHFAPLQIPAISSPFPCVAGGENGEPK